jgi:FecR protein
MKQARYAEAAGRLLKRLRTEGPAALPRVRATLVAAVDEALRRRARRLVIVRRGLALGAAAAVLAAVSFVGLRRASIPISAETSPADAPLTVLSAVAGVATSGDDRTMPLHQGMVITAGLRLTAPAIAEVQVGTTNGTALTLERGSELTVNEAGATQRFALSTGGVRAHVSRLIAGQRFIVDTADAEVEVHGTTFRVSIVPVDPTCGDGARTRVSVSEGVVTVRSALGEARVGRSAEWPAGCALVQTEPPRSIRPPRRIEPRAKSPEAGLPPAAPASRSIVTSPAPSPSTAEPARPTGGSLLAEQNDLFAAAIRAKQEGRAAEAAGAFATLIRSFPNGPLVESAMAQRMKALASFDPASATRAAADYLQRFPNGFARGDAQRLIVRSLP